MAQGTVLAGFESFTCSSQERGWSGASETISTTRPLAQRPHLIRVLPTSTTMLGFIFPIAGSVDSGLADLLQHPLAVTSLCPSPKKSPAPPGLTPALTVRELIHYRSTPLCCRP